MPAPFRVIAHRGASAYAPENTLVAFEKAIELGAEEVELDVRYSADGVAVVFHDDRLDNKTNLTGRVREHRAADLRCADIGRWFDVTHPEVDLDYGGTCVTDLESVFETLGTRVRYHVEIKDSAPDLPAHVLDRLKAHGLDDRARVTSFSMAPLVALRGLDADIPIGLLLRDRADADRAALLRPELAGRGEAEVHDYFIDAAVDAGFDQVGVRAADLEARTVAHAADRGIEVRGWGVRNDRDLLHLLRLGACGATVDWPDRALDLARRVEHAGPGGR